MKPTWITDWDEIADNETYIVCPINKGAAGSYCLGEPQWSKGWQVKRLLPRCYAAIQVPTFDGLLPTETAT